MQPVSLGTGAEVQSYEACRACVEELALYLKPLSAAKGVCVCVCVEAHPPPLPATVTVSP